MNQQHNQTGVVFMPKKGLLTTPVSQIPYLRHRGTFTAHVPDRPDAATAGMTLCRAIIEAILCPKRPITRRDTPHPRALQHLQTGVESYVIFDTGVAHTLFMISQHIGGTDSGSARRCHSSVGMVYGFD